MGNFYTDVIQKDRRYNSLETVADMALLEPEFRARVAALIAEVKRVGIEVQVLETFRSKARQRILFQKGATRLQNVGVHNTGLAVDLGIVKNGHVNWQADYRIFGRLAAGHDVVWGGDWGQPRKPHNFRDFDHLQGVPLERQKALLAGTWYPSAGYSPTKEINAKL